MRRWGLIGKLHAFWKGFDTSGLNVAERWCGAKAALDLWTYESAFEFASNSKWKLSEGKKLIPRRLNYLFINGWRCWKTWRVRGRRLHGIKSLVPPVSFLSPFYRLLSTLPSLLLVLLIDSPILYHHRLNRYFWIGLNSYSIHRMMFHNPSPPPSHSCSVHIDWQKVEKSHYASAIDAVATEDHHFEFLNGTLPFIQYQILHLEPSSASRAERTWRGRRLRGSLITFSLSVTYSIAVTMLYNRRSDLYCTISSHVSTDLLESNWSTPSHHSCEDESGRKTARYRTTGTANMTNGLQESELLISSNR